MKISPHLKATLQKLPAKPGVYVFLDEKNQILYVGKANNLRSRVRSYFQKPTSLEPAKQIMVQRVADIEYIIVDSETEALLLESTLIKKHRPLFNVIFRDDKFYQYIKITLQDEFPRVETVRRISKDGSRYFGPYTSAGAVKQTLKLLKRIFPYRSCKEPAYRPCFDARLNRCLGHDFGPGSKERYQDVVQKLIRFLEGDVDATLKDLKTQMQRSAQQRDFELAARLRDRVFAIEKIVAEQKVISTKLENEDYLGLARIADLAVVTIFQVRNGKLLNAQHFMLQHVERKTNAEVLASFVSQYYSQSTDHPDTVITSEEPRNAHSLSRALQLRFASPRRGKKRKLLKLAETNARDYLEHKQREWLSKEARAKLGLEELTRALELTKPPQRIECYDISNVQGTNAVGSMVVFENGMSKKSDYRKFQIKAVTGANDYAMLQEVLKRRFGHHATPPARGGVASRFPSRADQGTELRGRGWRETTAQTDEVGGWPLPHLIIIDGGKGQLNAALKVLREFNIRIPTIGLAKREEEIFTPGQKESIRLPKDSEGLFLIQRIRDEAHRFAIGYYRKRHGTETSRSLLDAIPGIGPNTKRLLLQTFGSVDGIRATPDEELEKLVGKKRTELLREHL